MTLPSLELRDANSGARAKILPGFGFNCYSFVVPDRGEPVELLWADPEFSSGTKRAAASGIPILFPFAGRIRGTSYTYQGKEYPLEVGDALGNAIHGFVLKRAWRVIEQSPSRAVAEFQASVDDPALLASWPADFRITAMYHVMGRRLISEITIHNPDQRPLPFGLGTHGYFRVPLGGGGKAADCTVTATVGSTWELQELRPTGRQLPAHLGHELRHGFPLGTTQLDNVYGGLVFHDGRYLARVVDPASSREVVFNFGDEFSYLVLFNPPHREAICIEPYTTLPDPFTLQQQGIDPTQRVLAPGATFHTRMEIGLT